jgi:hypothetical protein
MKVLSGTSFDHLHSKNIFGQGVSLSSHKSLTGMKNGHYLVLQDSDRFFIIQIVAITALTMVLNKRVFHSQKE